ncbi:hypothetical protein [Streptomyces griseomycini]|uniref:Uncharacterized protein n=1 Tax=Streptomyces griseomycini TaxID=66895 RepID=A0A7W7PYI4_9ACTN|nr:hypothetical protein [Streptomyces griseomycini]MBB4903680.1 hypothetical protein [Streptomyces griseomycini]
MLAEGLTALAAAGGSAVVQAAGTDAWTGLRRRVAEIFGRGDSTRAAAELERLEATAQTLLPVTSGAGDAAALRLRQEGVWAGRFEALLEGLDEEDRERAVTELRELVAFAAATAGDAAFATGTAVAQDGGSAVTGVKNTGPGRRGPARAAHTGNAEATGAGSSAITGIVNDNR